MVWHGAPGARFDFPALHKANYRIPAEGLLFGLHGRAAPILDMTANRVSYTLASTLESVNRAEETASRIAAEAGFADEEVGRISMAVREAAVNAVLHGNAFDPDKTFTLAFENTGHSLVITVRDQGRGLDIGNLPDPRTPENLLKSSGRGIFLIRAFMDEVHFRSLQPGTEITLIKHVGGNDDGAKENSK